MHLQGSGPLQHPGDGTESIKLGENNKFSFQSSYRPVIGVLPGSNDELAKWLTNEGFAVEQHSNLSICAFALAGTSLKGKRQLLEALKYAKGPLLRFLRWPKKLRSAMAISVDVDAITLMDFVRRAWHFLYMEK